MITSARLGSSVPRLGGRCIYVGVCVGGALALAACDRGAPGGADAGLEAAAGDARLDAAANDAGRDGAAATDAAMDAPATPRARVGLLWPDGVEPGEPSACEAPAGRRCWWVDAAAPAGGDGSYAAPFASFETVENAVRGGDYVYVRGTFDMSTDAPGHQMSLNFRTEAAGGTAAEPTTLKSWRGSPRAVFAANRADGQLRVSNSAGVRFQNLEITGFGDQGIVVGDAVRYADMVNIVAHDGEVTQSSGVGGALVLYARDSVHAFTVRNSSFYDTAGPVLGGNTGALSLISEPSALEGSTYTVYGNVFRDNHVAFRHKHAGRVHTDAHDNLFERNAVGFYLRTWTGEVHHNTLVANQIGVFLETDNMHADHTYRIHHNTLYDTDWLISAMPDQGGFVATVHVESNVFADPSGGLGVLHVGAMEWNWGANDISSWRMNNNVFFFDPPSRAFLFSPPPTESIRRDFAAARAQLGDTTSLFADPLFTNAAAGDFSLRPGSPALTAGSGGTAAGAVPSP